MKAIILSAGQGKRLLPLTEDTPKCLLPVSEGITMLDWQLLQLAEAGVEEAIVVTGFKAERVDEHLERAPRGIKVSALYNPHYATADNLGSVWMARDWMASDFLLINGDTLFQASVPERLMARRDPITVTVSHKDRYDEDDMKVHLTEDGRLTRVGKALDIDAVDGESIGMMLFRGAGVGVFRQAVETAMAAEDGNRVWYLSVLDRLADSTRIATCSVEQTAWCEVDFPVDLKGARAHVLDWLAADSESTAMRGATA